MVRVSKLIEEVGSTCVMSNIFMVHGLYFKVHQIHLTVTKCELNARIIDTYFYS